MRVARGFTLVEIIAAIAILAVLGGLIAAAAVSAQRRGRIEQAEATIERLRLALEQYAADFGDYPPTTLRALGASATNGVNEGIESAVRCLATRRERGPYLAFDERELGNTDGDAIARDPCDAAIAAKELFEVLDPWGNPFVYFHHRDYRGGAAIETYARGDGEKVRARPRPSEKTGAYPGLATFLIWSFGPNGQNEDGAGDDIASWR